VAAGDPVGLGAYDSVMDEKCTTCGTTAVCAYGSPAAEEFACRTHDPLARPGFMTTQQPPGWRYRTLDAYRQDGGGPATLTTLAPMLRRSLGPNIVIDNGGAST